MFKEKKFIIIDGNAIVHRSFHALPLDLTTKDGKIVNAVYGFTSVLINILKQFRPEYICLTFDTAGKTFRHKEYKEYKAKRIKQPQELYDQFPLIKEIVKAFGIPIYEKPGYEADDLIGTLINNKQVMNEKIKSIIVTGDLDALQLVNQRVTAYIMLRGLSQGIFYDKKMVEQKYNGLEPNQLVDYRALAGDASDNIKGVKGIGKKTAIKLLKEFHNLENIYKYLQREKEPKKINKKTVTLLLKYKKDAFLSKKIASIITNVKMDFTLENASYHNPDINKVLKILQRLEFKSLLTRLKDLYELNKNSTFLRLNLKDKIKQDKRSFNYFLIDKKEKFNKFLQDLERQNLFAFNVEADDNMNLLGISFSWKNKFAYYVKLSNNFNLKNDKTNSANKKQSHSLFNYKDYKNKTDFNIDWLKKLKIIFENKKIKKCGYNLKKNLKILDKYGIIVNRVYFDIKTAAYLLNPSAKKYDLNLLVFNEFGFDKISKKGLLESEDYNIKNLYIYFCENIDFIFRLIKKLKYQLEKNYLLELFEQIEIPLIPVLSKMELMGVKINVKYLQGLEQEIDIKIEKLKKAIYQQAGLEFNINSPKQLREILYNKLNLFNKNIGKGKTGYSTGIEELRKIKGQHLIVDLIIKYRELSKLDNTYIKSLPKLINRNTQKIYTNFNQTITSTGRLSSSSPNLQNIPVHSNLGNKIRRAFVAENNYKLLSFDYSQIELRLIAAMSNDQKMLNAFKQGIDIHKKTAAEINKINLDKVTKKMRYQAKAINFGVLYGQGPYGLSQGANISFNQARKFIKQYFEVYPKIKDFIKKAIDSAHNKGYAMTIYNRKRYLPEINSSIESVRKAAERMAVNMPIQGSAADIIKIAMLKIAEVIDYKLVRMILQVHDELIFEVKKDIIKETAEEIKNIMENVLKFNKPKHVELKNIDLVVNVKLGNNWADMKDLII